MGNKLDVTEIAEIIEQYFPVSSFDYSKIESGSSNSTYRINLNEQAYVLTMAYANLVDGWFGEVDYVLEDGMLVGRWTIYGDKKGKIGKEVLRRK